MIRLALALVILLAIVLVVRNLWTAVRDEESARKKAWDAPIMDAGVAVLSAPPRAWAWWAGLAFLAALANFTLIDRWLAGEGAADTWAHILLTTGLCAIAVRRFIQLSEKLTLTADALVAGGFWGVSWSMPLSELHGVGETRDTVILDFGQGRTRPVAPWLEGRFWLARQLRRDVLGRRGESHGGGPGAETQPG